MRNALDSARFQVETYQQSVATDSWKTNHDLAMRCMDIEAILKIGIDLYELIESLDEKWRRLVLIDEGQYDEKVTGKIESLFDMWLVPCPRVDRAVRDLEQGGFTVDGATKFRLYHNRILSVRDEQ